ncbi:hypothetical protein AWC16_20055 [Mycolicibacter longobardus]|uniref:DUF3322 and DUF2220 domain-containing protein n=2 Tax=Mycobacteriaceae TaxID=1762 RepID=A0A1X1YAA4_9MYCO|nr:hypothetical protein AWC16_20055 [Mycolicibacter longobardus]
MLTVDQAVRYLRAQCEDHWLEWLLGRGRWPISVTLGAPRGDQFDRNVIAAKAWAGTWESAITTGRIPGQLRTESRRARKLGLHDLPTTWILPTPGDALAVAPETATRHAAANARLQQAIALPGSVWASMDQIPVKTARAIADLGDDDWTNATAAATHLAVLGPGEASMVRQLAIPGVHSKWIESNATLLGALLGVPADPTLGPPLVRLINHIGLRPKPTAVHVTLACPRLRAQAAGLTRLSATIADLNTTTLRPRVVLIIENLELAHTLTADLPGVAAICGLGAGAPTLTELAWTHTADTVLYWGDIDRAGLAILATTRRAGIPAKSLLMDEATLDAYPAAHHETSTQTDSYEIPGGLDLAETKLYGRLNAHHANTGQDLQLEQEHIPISTAHAAILKQSAGAGT